MKIYPWPRIYYACQIIKKNLKNFQDYIFKKSLVYMFHMYLNHDHNGSEVNNSKFTVNTDLHKPRMG